MPSAEEPHGILHKTMTREMETLTKENPFSGKYLVGIYLELLLSEEYDLPGCGSASNSDSILFKEGILSWKSI